MASLTTSGLLKTPLKNSQSPANYFQYPPFAYGQHQLPVSLKRAFPGRAVRASPSNSGPSTSSSPGLYSAQKFELTIGNVDLVLEDVRPYLIADGGNVDVVSVEDGVVSLKLVGACGSCPSSTTTMKMGIERVLKEKFGDSVKEICQVYDEEPKETTPEAVNNHLDILRPAIRNYGGSVEVISINGGDCLVKYEGPESIGTGVKAAIKERFPDITNVVFSS
ncbi:nifU-like protein 1 [Cucumis melo var. makuwa]|uniref:NifU-like protein 1 n=1 Tax=Cucumis melo var. makuwa TaxID=1194695 RepID=A0A5A7TT28_CUCMM|nr:nifU-like protein 1 [Cucumis melo var. makuwa]TYK18249.1 nifU-like protein 1 [Cucumis melo var. makuwa]